MTLALARRPELARFGRLAVARLGARRRLARIAALFTFVGHAVDAPPAEDGQRDGLDLLLALAGPDHGPAVILAALLLALGESARVIAGERAALVCVRIDAREVARLPPHSTVLLGGGSCHLLLDPRTARSPLGFVPRPLRDAMVDTLSTPT